MVLAMRERLGQFGWDNGPRSIWYALIDQPNVVQPIPSVSTIARILAAAGVVAKNPRKRPRSSIVRFERSCAMELWQLDEMDHAGLHHGVRLGRLTWPFQSVEPNKAKR